MTGGRIKRVAPYLDGQDFCMTYGDGVSDIDLHKLLQFHRSHGLAASVTVVQPLGRFGSVIVGGEDGRVTRFEEKPAGDGRWVNAGFFVLSPKVLDYIEDDATIWERAPMDALAGDGQLSAFKHHGFWQAMDTMREREYLEELWASGNAPWKSWTA
jgi:glucose-1-phosphate cytidylyltransferase